MRRLHKIAILAILMLVMWGAQVGTSEAQHGRPVFGRGHAVVVGGGYWGYPYWGWNWGFGWGWGWGWGPYGAYGWGYPGYGYPGYYYGDEYGPGASVRLQVKPKDAQVYVDGYYAGIVDDYDGVFQRLRVRAGQHEVVLYLKGYHTVRQVLNLRLGEDYKVHYTMAPLGPGEKEEPPPLPPARPETAPSPREPRRGYGYGQMPGSDRPPTRMPAQPGVVQAQSYGALVVRVQPGGAEVVIDGEQWQGPEGQDRLVVQVAEGTHRVEIRKDGFNTFSTEVHVGHGETVPLNVSLVKEPGQ